MKLKYKIGAMLLSVCMLLQMFGITSQAASGSVKVTSASGTVGKNVTITCTTTCSSGPIGFASVVLTYSPSALEWVSGTNMAQGGSGSVRYEGVTPDGSSKTLSFSMTFKILKEGSHSVSVSTASASDIDESVFAPSKSGGTIKGTAPSTSGGNSGGNQGGNTQTGKDSNNKLSTLKVYPGTLSPSFNANVKSYNVTVPADTTKVTISATPQSTKAKVTVSGGNNLQHGLNTAKVIVVAENGSSTSYVITIMRGEDEKISVEGIDHTIDENFTEESIPAGFTRTKVSYKEREYEAIVNAKNTMHLVCLKNETESKFYIYDVESQEFSQLILIERGEGKYLIPLPLGDRVGKYKNAEVITIQLGEQYFDAWKIDEEFSIVYAMNQDGDELLYRYDIVEEIFQRYTDVELDLDLEEEKETLMFPSKYYMYAIAGLGGLCLILLIAMIYFIASRKQRHEARKKKMQRKLEKQRAKEAKIAEKERIAAEKERIAAEKAAEKQRLKEEKKLAKQKKKEQ